MMPLKNIIMSFYGQQHSKDTAVCRPYHDSEFHVLQVLLFLCFKLNKVGHKNHFDILFV